MALEESKARRHSLVQRLLQGTTFLLLLLMPFSLFLAIGPTADARVFTLYAQRGLYLADLPLALIVVLALGADLRWRRGPVLATSALILLCALAFLSIPRAVSTPFAFYIAVRWLLALLVYFWFLRTPLSIKRLALVFALGLAVHAIVGIMQVILQRPLGLPGELALSPETRGAAILPLNGVRWLRAYGLTFHPNVLGGFLATAILLFVPWLRGAAAILLWALLWAGLLATFSRSAWIALALALPIALLVTAAKEPQARGKLAVAVAVALLVVSGFLFLATEQVLSRLGPLAELLASGEAPPAPEQPREDTEAFSLTERASLLEVALEVIRERPFNGVGAGNFPLAMVQLRPSMRTEPVHNVPLLLAAEVGVLGGVAWLLLGLAVAGRFIGHLRTANAWLLCAMCAWFALAVISMVDSYPWALNSGLLLAAMVLGLASRAPGDDGSGSGGEAAIDGQQA